MESSSKTFREKFIHAVFNILFFALIGGLVSTIGAAIVSQSADETLAYGIFGAIFGAIIGLINAVMPALIALKEIVVQKITKGKTDETND